MDFFETINKSRGMILNQRDGIYNASLTISGTALVLSVSLIGNFKEIMRSSDDLFFLRLSWLLLIISIISNILMRYFNGNVSLINIEKELFKFENPNQPIEAFFKEYKPERKDNFLGNLFFYLFWITFICGLLSLLLFAMKLSDLIII